MTPGFIESRHAKPTPWTTMRTHRASPFKRLQKKTKRGFVGFPMATIAFYGPDDRSASKIAVAVFVAENEEPDALKRWFEEGTDVSKSPRVAQEVIAFLEERHVKSVTMTDRIIGCPHEEGVDYEGPVCPMCPFWANRDRWTGKLIR